MSPAMHGDIGLLLYLMGQQTIACLLFAEVQAQCRRHKNHGVTSKTFFHEVLFNIVNAIRSEQLCIAYRGVATIGTVFVPSVFVGRIGGYVASCLSEAQIVAKCAIDIHIAHIDKLILNAPKHTAVAQIGALACGKGVYLLQMPEAVEIAIVARFKGA